ncbi:MAG: hypothetical protein M1824_003479 [Vezdaea acicularis]|nr:MAG: hypothetical protein M1824_003479 [Vezdaea acicularis]
MSGSNAVLWVPLDRTEKVKKQLHDSRYWNRDCRLHKQDDGISFSILCYILPDDSPDLINRLQRDILVDLGIPELYSPGALRRQASNYHPLQTRTVFSPRELALKDCFPGGVPENVAKFSGRMKEKIYPPLLILSGELPALSPELQARFYERLATHYALKDVTHIAIEAPIPESGDGGPNYLRLPGGFRPVYGDFGKRVEGDPNPQDLKEALFVSCMQNGIRQTWAPLYTMFSRGNVTEKLRILKLPTLQPPIIDPTQTTAVDLFAGIGYFAFSYAKAGVSKVLCWELNPWSVEGLLRGAELNGWNATKVSEDALLDSVDSKKLLVFQENNSKALKRIRAMRHVLPPVRHVNCGLLPTSSEVWADAARVLDPEVGGYIHVHENVKVLEPFDLVKKQLEIVKEFEAFIEGSNKVVECEHAERVKSYAPKMWHYVFDIHILSKVSTAPLQSESTSS